MNFLIGLLLFVWRIRQILSECLIPDPTNPTTKCLYCKSAFYQNSVGSPFLITDCSAKLTTNYKRDILIVAGTDVTASDWPSTDKYLNLDDGLVKESTDSIKYTDCQLSFYLTKGTHYMYRKTFSNSFSFLFRRSHCTINIAYLLCTTKAITSKCLNVGDPSSAYPIVKLKSAWNFLFASVSLKIEGIIFDGSDLNYPTGTDLNTGTTCFNSNNDCCVETALAKTSAVDASCGVKGLTLVKAKKRTFCLFNVESNVDKSPFTSAKLTLRNIQVNNFWLFNDEIGFYCLTRVAANLGSIEIDGVSISSGVIPHGILLTEVDSSLYDPSFYISSIQTMISALPSTSFSSNTISTLNLQLTDYNKYVVIGDIQIGNLMEIIGFKGSVNIIGFLANCAFPGNSSFLLSIANTSITLSNLTLANTTNTLLLTSASSIISADISIYNTTASSTSNFLESKTSTFTLTSLLLYSIVFTGGKLSINAIDSTISIKKGNWTSNTNIGLAFTGLSMELVSINIASSTFQGSFLKATNFLTLTLTSLTFTSLTSGTSAVGVIDLASTYTILSKYNATNITVVSTISPFFMKLDKINSTSIKGLNFTSNTQLTSLWQPGVTFDTIIVEDLSITQCEFGSVFEMDENTDHKVNFTNFKVSGLNLTGWVFFFYSNGIWRFNNLYFTDLVMKSPGNTYMYVTLQLSSTYFKNVTCIDCGYIFESPTYLGNQAEMSLVAGWQAIENTYEDFYIKNTGKKLNFNGAILVHITVQTRIMLRNVTIINLYTVPDNFVYRGLTLSNPITVQIYDSVFINNKCPDTPAWRQLFQYVNGAVLAYESFATSYSPTSNVFNVSNVTMSDCSCAASGGGLSVVNYHNLIFSAISFTKTKADRGGQISIFSSTNVTLSKITMINSSAIEGSSLYVKVVKGTFSVSNSSVAGSYGINTGAFHFVDVDNLILSQMSFSNVGASEGSAGGVYLESTSASLSDITIANANSGSLGGFIMSTNCIFLSLTRITSVLSKSGSGGFLYSESTDTITISNLTISNAEAIYDGGGLYIYDSVNLTVSNVSFRQGKAQNGMFNYMSFSSLALVTYTNITCDSCSSELNSCISFESPSNFTLTNLTSNLGIGKVIDASYFYSFNLAFVSISLTNMTSSTSLLEFSNSNLTLGNLNLLNCSAKTSMLIIESNLKSELKKVKFINCGGNVTANKSISCIDSSLSLSDLTLQSNDLNLSKSELLSLSNCQVSASNTIISSGIANEKSGIVSCLDSQLVLTSFQCSNSFGPCISLDSCSLTASTLSMDSNTGTTDISADLYSIGPSDVGLNGWISTNSNWSSIGFRDGFQLKMENSRIQRTSKDIEMRGLTLFNLNSLILFKTNFTNLNNPEAAGVRIDNSNPILTNKILVDGCSCSQSSGLIGSCFMLSGNHNSTFSNNTFVGNMAMAHSKINESGVGASILGICQDFNNTCVMNASGNSFSNNFAAKLAPNIFSSANVNSFSGNNYSNNSEALDVNVTSYAGPLQVMQIPLNGKKEVIIASGQADDLVFGFMDFSGKLISIVSTSIANFVPKQEGVTLENSLTGLLPNGTLNFSKFKMKFPPNSNTTLKLTLSLSMPELFLTSSLQVFTSDFTFVSRACVEGEIFFQGECKPCLVGTYSLLSDPMTQPIESQICIRCPTNSQCFLKYILPDPGFWKYSDSSTLMLKCLIETYCLGGISISQIKTGNISANESSSLTHGQCQPGHTGNLCSMCIPGYGRMNPTDFCEPCKNQLAVSIVRTIFILIGVVIYIVVMSKTFADKHRKSAFVSFLLKLLINHFQVLSIITFNQVGFDVSFLQFGLEFANILTFRVDYFSSDCLLDEMGSNTTDLKIAKVGASLVLPVILSLIAFVTWMLVAFCILRRNSSVESNSFIYQKRILISFVISIYLFYPLIIGSCFSLLNCIEIDNSTGTYVLFSEPELYCWKSPHSDYLLEAALPGILLWGMAFPIFLYYILKGQRNYSIRMDLFMRKIPSLEINLDKKNEKGKSKIAVKNKKSKRESAPKIEDCKEEAVVNGLRVTSDSKKGQISNISTPNAFEMPEISLIHEEAKNSKPNIRYVHLNEKEKEKERLGGSTGSDSKNSIPKQASNFAEDLESKELAMGSPIMVGRPKSSKLYEEEIFSFFYDGFKREALYWETIILLKKFLLTLIASLTQLLSSTTRNTLIMLILFYSFSATLKIQPFKSELCNNLEYLSLISLLVTSFSAVINFIIVEYSIKTLFALLVFLVNAAFLIAVVIAIVKNLDIKNKFVSIRSRLSKKSTVQSRSVKARTV